MLEEAAIDGYRASTDPLAPLRNHSEPPTAVERLLSLTARDRAGPQVAGQVSALARERWKADATYRPKTLERVRAGIDAGG